MRIIDIIFLSPFAIMLIFVDIVKLPLMPIIMTFTFWLALYEKLKNPEDSEWFSYWLSFNLEIGCMTYQMIKEVKESRQ